MERNRSRKVAKLWMSTIAYFCYIINLWHFTSVAVRWTLHAYTVHSRRCVRGKHAKHAACQDILHFTLLCGEFHLMHMRKYFCNPVCVQITSAIYTAQITHWHLPRIVFTAICWPSHWNLYPVTSDLCRVGKALCRLYRRYQIISIETKRRSSPPLSLSIGRLAPELALWYHC